MMAYRIGIDVGGTFTHAVAVEADTLQVAFQAKVPTTHRAAEGVALGVTRALRALLEAGVHPESVIFIAHSTTQATNALLEGDVATVGIVGMARGADALRARKDTDVGRLEVAPGRFLETVHSFITSDEVTPERLRTTIGSLRERGAQVIVGAEAFGVDNPANERRLLDVCAEMGLPATASHEVSGLYGLSIRTRTAVINASILPKMVQTATMTARAVSEAGIAAPLMIMRSDGGVMSVDEMRRRPILTILSGPAAGVAAALMYARISDGIFVEVGGTSSDITCIRNGQAAVQSATLGGRKLFLRTLDVRTIGLAGGSMVHDDPHWDALQMLVGPRSAHMAGLPYSCFTTVTAPCTIIRIQPMPNDPSNYLAIEDAEGKRAAITMTCAANAAGMVPDGDYAKGDGTIAGEMLAHELKMTPVEAGEAILNWGSIEVEKTVLQLLQDYQVPREHVTLIGGGGGAGAVVPYTGKMMRLPWRIAENAPVISAIGVALALVRDTVERTIPNPTKEDLLRVRQEAVDAVTRMGAAPETIEVQVEVDSQQQVVRATASGATELRARDLAAAPADAAAQTAIAAASLGVAADAVRELARTAHYAALGALRETKKLFGLIKTSRTPARLVDANGVIRLQLTHADAAAVPAAEALQALRAMIGVQAHYGDGGERLPAVFLAAGPRIFNLSGLLTAEHILSLAETELQRVPADQPVLLVVGEQS